jgi:RNA polymerase sigma factor (sigma-70 family)
MSENDWLAERFEESRAHLHAVAYRMLGSASEAEDAVQETWLRLHRSDTAEVANLGGWLTTVTARVCLDMLRSRKSRREEPLGPGAIESAEARANGIGPAEEALLAHSVGLALLVVLETLTPAERVSFVLHDLFDLPFEEIAPIVGRSQEAARQLASRARRRVRGIQPPASADLAQQRAVVDAFLAAARAGRIDKLIALLDPEVVFRADSAAMRGPAREVRGAAAVAKLYSGRAQGAGTGLVDGAVGIVVAPLGRLMMAIRVTLAGGRITELDVVADPEKLREVEITALDS